MKEPVEIICEEKAKAFTSHFDHLLFDIEISNFLTACQEEEETEISGFFDTIILLENITYSNIS